MARKLMGEMLLEAGLISEEQLKKAIARSLDQRSRLGHALLEQGLVTEHDVAKVVATQLNLQFVDLRDAKFHPDAVKMVPEAVARRTSAVPMALEDKTLTVAISDPLNIVALNELTFITKCGIKTVVMAQSDIDKAIERVYIHKEFVDPRERAADAPVVRVVETIIQQAIAEEASDIHLEPWPDLTRLRYRIDGSLVEVNQLDKDLHPGIVSRIKILAGMDISERRLPQDGSIGYSHDGGQFDLRVSTLPTVTGEKVVIRILNQSLKMNKLSDLGMAADTERAFAGMLKQPFGMLLVCGPTGSGKSTTLNIALQMLNAPDRNIVTIEDPVEYRVQGVNQVQINPRAGLMFANVLRSVVRQDPNIIMVGEIRDLETADTAVRSALTGHLVLSTLHTNDAPGAITRLVDMGAEPYLVASSVIGILSQRLVRRVCPHCAVGYDVGPLHPEVLALGMEPGNYGFRRGKGCGRCHDTGYRGRLGIFEILPITDRFRELIIRSSPTSVLKREAVAAGMRTLAEDGIIRAREGVTTSAEVLRVTMLDINA